MAPQGALPVIGRQCGCVPIATEMAIAYLNFDMMVKAYGRIVTRAEGVPWGRCPYCGGTGIDKRA